MDVTELANCVRQNGDDILAEVFFQDWFGVSLSRELSMPKTDSDVAKEMLVHAGIFTRWPHEVGEYFECNNFELNELQHYLKIVVFNPHQIFRYRVSLMSSNFLKYGRAGDNLVALLYDMLKSEF